MQQNIARTDPAGKLEKALERNILTVKHDRLLPLLDLTLGEVLDVLSDSNKTRIPRPCSRGSVPGGAVQCSDEVQSYESTP